MTDGVDQFLSIAVLLANRTNSHDITENGVKYPEYLLYLPVVLLFSLLLSIYVLLSRFWLFSWLQAPSGIDNLADNGYHVYLW